MVPCQRNRNAAAEPGKYEHWGRQSMYNLYRLILVPLSPVILGRSLRTLVSCSKIGSRNS